MTRVLTWPLRLGADGELVTAEQDSPQDKVSCVTAILSYSKGWRTDNMDFGRPADLIFTQGGADVAAIAEAIQDQDPRATPEIVASALENSAQTVKVRI